MEKEIEKPDINLGDELPQDQVAKIEDEIVSGYRDFEVKLPKETYNLRVFHPSNKEQSLISAAYTKKYNELMNTKEYKLWDEIVNDLKERKVWSDEDDTLEEDLQENIIEILKQYLKIKGNNPDDNVMLPKLRLRYFELKKKIDRFNEKRSKYYANSIESKANEVALKYKIVFCLKKRDGENLIPMFNSVDDIDESRDNVLLNSILRTCISFWAGLKQEYLNEAPEADWFFGGNGLHTLLEDSDGESSTKSIKTVEKASLVEN